MSSMRSASSSTRISRPAKFTDSCRMWSISRPGVATTMSTPARSARSCVSIAHAAVHRDARNRRVVRQPLHLIFDLDGQLARRRQHQRAGRGRARRHRVEEALENRHEERRGLAGAGLGAGDDVAAGQRERNHAALDRPRLVPAEVADAAEQPRVEAQLDRTRSAPGRTPTTRTAAVVMSATGSGLSWRRGPPGRPRPAAARWTAALAVVR